MEQTHIALPDCTDYRRGATDLGHFGRYYLPHYFTRPSPPFHRQLDTLWKRRVMKGMDPVTEAAAMLAAPGKRSAVAAPRGHAKSTVMTLKNVLHAALYGYKQYILLISDTETQAAGFLESIKYELETNPGFCGILGSRWGKRPGRPPPSCCAAAAGSTRWARGRSSGAGGTTSGGPTSFCATTSKTTRGVRTAEQRRKTADWFWKAVCKAGDSYTDLVTIGTILHYDSLLARLLDNPGFSSKIFRAVLSESPSPLWEEWRKRFTDLSDPKREEHALTFYHAHKREMNAGAKSPLAPEVQLLRPAGHAPDGGGRGLSKRDAKRAHQPGGLPLLPAWFQYYDLAAPWTCGPPPSAFTATATPPSGPVGPQRLLGHPYPGGGRGSGLAYVLLADIARRHPDQIIADILITERRLRQTYGKGYTLFGAETNQFQWFLKEQLAMESARQGIYLPIQGVRSAEDKTIRVSALQPDVKTGTCALARTSVC